LTNKEVEILLVAISVANHCHYCADIHATFALAAGVSKDEIREVRDGGLPKDIRLRSLIKAAKIIMDKKATLNEEDKITLQDLSISQVELYDIAAIIGMMTAANYLNILDMPQIEPEFNFSKL